jgi:hypothetical protein
LKESLKPVKRRRKIEDEFDACDPPQVISPLFAANFHLVIIFFFTVEKDPQTSQMRKKD